MAHDTLQFVPREVWDMEYSSVKAIPSSTREEPAKALVLFADLMGLFAPKRVLDAGCGNGRNAVFLAGRGCNVTAVDFSQEALKETKRRAHFAGVEANVGVLEHFIGDPLPIRPGFFDAALDCYTFCHFLSEQAGRRFWSEVARVVRPKGQILSIVFSLEDEYYAQFLQDAGNGHLVIDPSNKVSKKLYSEAGIKAYFSQMFTYRFFAKFEFLDLVRGEEYRRVVFISVLEVP